MTNKQIVLLVRRVVRKELNKRTAEILNVSNKLVFSKGETAMMLSISTRTLDRWRKEGKITPIKNVEKGKILFAKEEITKLLNIASYGR